MPNAPKNPRILIVRLGAMGDVLHALPMAAMLRLVLPGAQIDWVVERRWSELLCAPESYPVGECSAGRPLVNAVLVVDTRGWRKHLLAASTRREFTVAVAAMRAAHYDAALDVQGAAKSAAVARLCGATKIFGFSEPREWPARLAYDVTIEPKAAHVIVRNLEMASALLARMGHAVAELPEKPMAEWLPRDLAAERRVEAALLSHGVAEEPLAVLNPGAGWCAKQWPEQRYGELAERLKARGLRVLLNYGPGEEPLVRRAAQASHGAALPLFTSLGELVALLRRAHLFVGGDTGPLHLAALLGVPTVALFGPTDPERNGPYWPGCRTLRDTASETNYSHRRTEDAGLRNLTTTQVFEAVESLLA
jgi:heptosyltransferase-1